MASHTQVMGLMLAVMLSTNIGLALFQTGVDSYGTTTSVRFNSSDTPYSDYVDGGISDGESKINESYLPTESTTTTDDTGFFEIVKKISGWVFGEQMNTNLKFAGGLLTQPGGFLRDIGFPPAISTGFQVIWSLIFILTLVAFIMGR